MEVESFMSILSNVGFPIACVIAMFYMWNKEREEHKEETTKLAESINNNTKVMEKLLMKLGENVE